jgi:hypothetical protein
MRQPSRVVQVVHTGQVGDPIMVCMAICKGMCQVPLQRRRRQLQQLLQHTAGVGQEVVEGAALEDSQDCPLSTITSTRATTGHTDMLAYSGC